MGRYDKITPMLYGANLHKGKISVESEIGKGSKFILEI